MYLSTFSMIMSGLISFVFDAFLLLELSSIFRKWRQNKVFSNITTNKLIDSFYCDYSGVQHTNGTARDKLSVKVIAICYHQKLSSEGMLALKFIVDFIVMLIGNDVPKGHRWWSL